MIKELNNFLLVCTQMKRHSTLMKILVVFVVVCCNETVIFIIDHNTINLDNNFDEDDPDIIIIHIRLLAWHIKFEKHKALKDLPIAWYPKRWWNICMSEDEKKGHRTDFYRVMLLIFTVWKY